MDYNIKIIRFEDSVKKDIISVHRVKACNIQSVKQMLKELYGNTIHISKHSTNKCNLDKDCVYFLIHTSNNLKGYNLREEKYFKVYDKTTGLPLSYSQFIVIAPMLFLVMLSKEVLIGNKFILKPKESWLIKADTIDEVINQVNNNIDSKEKIGERLPQLPSFDRAKIGKKIAFEIRLIRYDSSKSDSWYYKIIRGD